MRVSTVPGDPHYVDARHRRAWVNDQEVLNWAVADEFRRCVIDLEGRVYNGSVRVERLPAVGYPEPDKPSTPITGFVGVLVSDKEPPTVQVPVAVPVPTPALKKVKRGGK